MARPRRSSDFSPIAHRYDQTRHVPQDLLDRCYRRFVGHGLLPRQGLICDAGCGTGQATAALLGLGYAVQGFDISPAMLGIARAKYGTTGRAAYAAADVRALPTADGCFDAVVVSKLFQHVEGWQEAGRELLRVLKPGGCLFNVNERGAFGNRVRKYFGQCADSRGLRVRMLGRHDREALRAFFVAAGCEDVTIDVTDLRWQSHVALGDVLDQFRERLFAEFWYLPPADYQSILAETAAWLATLPDGLATVQHLTPYLVADIFRKPAGSQ